MSESLSAFAADLSAASAKVLPELRGVFQEASSDLKDKWRENASANYLSSARPHAPAYPASITYETHLTRTGIYAEVGPKHEGQGMLAPILEFGSPTSPAHLDGQRAADEIIPKIERRIASAITFLGP